MLDSRQYLPRKGTETLSDGAVIPNAPNIPDNIYPARGRKPYQLKLIIKSSLCHSRQYLPRKGTETKHAQKLLAWEIVVFPTIFTPQGDGNIVLTPKLIKQKLDIPDNIYPARGRKHKLTHH